MADSIGEVVVQLATDMQDAIKDFLGVGESAKEMGDAITGAAATATIFNDAAQAIIDIQKELDGELAQATQAFHEISEAFQKGEVDATTLKRAEEELSEATRNAGREAHESHEHFEELLEKLLEFGGIALTFEFLAEKLKEIAEESAHVFAETERVGEAMSFLTGNAKLSGEMMEKIDQIGMHYGEFIPNLEKAAQSMLAYGLNAEQASVALVELIGVSRVLGTSVEGAASRLDRVVQTGTLSNRSLLALRLTTADVAKAMRDLGASSDEIDNLKDSFHRLTQESRADVMIQAMEQMRTFAEKTANDAEANFTRIRNTWHNTLLAIGQETGPAFIKAAEIFNKFVFEIVLGTTIAATRIKQLVLGMAALGEAAKGHVAVALADYVKIEQAGDELAGKIADMVMQFKELQNLVAAGGEYKPGPLKFLGDEAAEAEDKFKPFSLEMKSFDAAVMVEQMRLAEAELKKWIKAVADAGGMSKFAANWARDFAEAAGAPDPVSLKAYNDELARVHEIVQGLVTTPVVIPDLTPLQQAFLNIGTTIDGVKSKVADAVASFGVIASQATSVAMLEAGWNAVGSAITTLSKTDLPTAVQMQGEYIEGLKRLGAGTLDVLEAEKARVEMQIKLAEQQGTNADVYYRQLANIKILMQDAIDSTKGLGLQIEEVLTPIVRNMWDAWASGFAKAIEDGKKFGDTMMNVLRQIENQILSGLIGFALRELSKALGDVLVKLHSIVLQKIGVALGGGKKRRRGNQGEHRAGQTDRRQD